MDSKRASKPVNEASGSSILKELLHGPLHSHESLDGVSWYDLQVTTLIDVEFKNVLDTDVSVLAAELLLDLSVLLQGLVPLVHFDSLIIHQN